MSDGSHGSISWEGSLEGGLARARQDRKLVLLDFFNPT
jgi:hypothetical protein